MDGAALVAKVFDAFDRSADGYLDRDELFEFFSKVVAPGALLKQLKVETIEAAAEALLKRADADGDGRIRCAFDPRHPVPVPPRALASSRRLASQRGLMATASGVSESSRRLLQKAPREQGRLLHCRPKRFRQFGSHILRKLPGQFDSVDFFDNILISSAPA